MRIISQFHDYYDTARSYGFDPNILYIRKTEDLQLSPKEEKILEPTKLYPRYCGELIIARISLCFCGKIYRGFNLTVYDKYNLNPTNYGYIWSFDKLMKVFPKITNYYTLKKYQYSWSIHNFNERTLRSYFENDQKQSQKEIIDLHLKYKTPLISYSKSEYILDPLIQKDICLRSVNFQQVMDPFKTFQELSMFVGNILISQSKEPWPISDKLKAQSKGFDDYSFRKRPKNIL
jgi:hypothetical protein